MHRNFTKIQKLLRAEKKLSRFAKRMYLRNPLFYPLGRWNACFAASKWGVKESFGDVAFRRRGTRAGDYNNGDVAQLARALDWQSRGRRFEPDLLHV